MNGNKKQLIFTVILPTYNREKLIGKAIESILNQTYQDFELIIVDDGSKDNTQKVVEQYKADKIRYIYKKNGGQNSALNVGLKEARGKYVAFLDSDDMWLPTKLEKVYQKYKSDPDISVVYHSTGKLTQRKENVAVYQDFLEGYIYKEVLEQGFLASQISLSAKRECFQEIGYYDEKFDYGQDDDICFMLSKRYKVGLVKEVLSVIGGKADNRTTDNYKKVSEGYIKLINKYKADILEFCGRKKLADMYCQALIYCMDAGEWTCAVQMSEFAQKYGTGGIYNKYWLLFRGCLMSFWHCFNRWKHVLWRNIK